MTFLYRAVPAKDFDPNRVYVRQATVRTPMNIPYVVDNFWEAIRPDHMPSRRHSAYASPTPELAMANASAAADGRYVVCKLEMTGPVRIAQLQVTDAREHADIRFIQKAALEVLGEDIHAQTLWQRSVTAALYLPGLSADHLYELAREHSVVDDALNEVRDRSTFWDSAHEGVNPASSGELFFELLDGDSYRLTPLEMAQHAAAPSLTAPITSSRTHP